MLILEDLLYTEDHLWIKILETERVSLGITDYGQSLLGEFSSLDIPDAGEKLVEGDLMATAQDIDGELMELSSPVTGTVTVVNPKVINDPDIVSKDPYEDGWLVQMKLEQPKELDDLMTPEDYELFVEEQRILREDRSEGDMEDELEVVEK